MPFGVAELRAGTCPQPGEEAALNLGTREMGILAVNALAHQILSELIEVQRHLKPRGGEGSDSSYTPPL
jgi:hypothetical protein